MSPTFRGVVTDWQGRSTEQSVTFPAPAGPIQRFLVPAYTPARGMGAQPDAVIVEQAGPDGVIVVQTSMLQAGRVAGLRAEAAKRGWRQQIWLYELPQVPGTWMTLYQEASLHADWWLRDAAGSRLKPGSAPDRAGVLDFSNEACRRYVEDHLMGWIDGDGLDGYFNDGESAQSLQVMWSWTPSAPTMQQIATHRLSQAVFAEEMRMRLQGREFWWNLMDNMYRYFTWSGGYRSDWTSPEFDRIRRATTGSMMEGRYHAPWECVDYLQPTSNVEGQMQLVRDVIRPRRVSVYAGTRTNRGPRDASGRCIGNAGTPAEMQRWRDFSFALYLIHWMPGDLFTWYRNGPVEHGVLLGIDVGMPLEPVPTAQVGGLWRRRFEGATVLANTSTSGTVDGVGPQQGIISLR